MINRSQVKRKQKWRWLLWSISILLLVGVVAAVIDSGCKHYFRIKVCATIPLVGVPLRPYAVPLDDSTDIWVLSYGFLDYEYQVFLAKRWSLAPKAIMNIGSGVRGSIEILYRSDGMLFALRYHGWIVDHYDVPQQHPVHGPQYYGLSNNDISDELREYDKQVREWLGSDYQVVWNR